MATRTPKRVQETKTLHDILPSRSPTSGREFARIVNLLLFHDGRRNGRTVTLFDDRAGDVRGLDAFEEKDGTLIGYQHKFYPSPLSADHRKAIEQSLRHILESERERIRDREERDKARSLLKRWILVTPEDFVESATRKAGGMSIYKEEAARTVPMENIYIPLSVIPNDADENDSNVPRRNPLEFLAPGTRHVVLGDPGSGKTTLLRFLALFGQSKPLQQRYKNKGQDGRFHFEPDARLPIFITLRRYADALKTNDNLSLIDYMRENIAADFSMADVSIAFLEYYLESGQAILLFDGLDELPTSSFKQKIRNRIRNLTETYPGNTTIVSSRVYGYEDAFRFDDREFAHHRVAKLGLAEIKQFVRDWYQARLEKPQDRREFQNSLLGILQNEEHEAIRELARNPLLLTIIVLVHRIDAVLPDERHVLYQKCTETLLNTWHTWKFHEMDRLHRAKVDRLNMQRMQAIAYWMQHQMGGAGAGQQAVVPYKALHKHLSEHIASETPPNPDYAPEDIATAFIEFVQDRAGLLAEIGDREFSFVHLTFQEYLTAVHIRTLSELHGVREAWSKEIAGQCSGPRWREVLRLLVAGYDSNASQEFLVDNILDIEPAAATTAQLFGGLLLDGVAAAQMKKQAVFERLLLASSRADDANELKNTLMVLRACREKADRDWHTFRDAAHSLGGACKSAEEQTRLRLTVLATGLDLDQTWELCGHGSEREAAMLSLLTGSTLAAADTQVLDNDLRLLWAMTDDALLSYMYGSFCAAAIQRVAEGAGLESGWRRAFEMLLTVLVWPSVNGPASYLVSCLLLASRESSLIVFRLNLDRGLERTRAWALEGARALEGRGLWRGRGLKLRLRLRLRFSLRLGLGPGLWIAPGL
jgi:hypothetical protein